MDEWSEVDSSNIVPEHMNDPKSENWTKYGIVYGISNEIPIMTHGSAHGKRFIGPNMETEDKNKGFCEFRQILIEISIDPQSVPLNSTKNVDEDTTHG